jgi:hypothetical protein
MGSQILLRIILWSQKLPAFWLHAKLPKINDNEAENTDWGKVKLSLCITN